MLFYIVTPAFNALPWLQRCIRSVADQAGEGLRIWHHVQDGASADGTPAWLAAWQAQHAATPGYVFTYESARDSGMYDAINRAWDNLPPEADFTAHLNSDEQYLPGALAQVARAMQASPRADIALGSYIVADARSRYICHRRPILPHAWSSRTVCEIITCSCFHRAEPFRRRGIRFDTRWRAIADLHFYLETIKRKPRFLLLPGLVTTCFALTGNNLAWSETGERELAQTLAALPWPVARSYPFVNAWCNLKRRVRDLLCAPPASYSLYAEDSPARTSFRISRPTSHWGRRTVGEG